MSLAEFQGWIKAMNRQVEGQKTSPDRWDGHEHDPGWIELRRQREQWRAGA